MVIPNKTKESSKKEYPMNIQKGEREEVMQNAKFVRNDWSRDGGKKRGSCLWYHEKVVPVDFPIEEK
jgi:hypothetical protein